MGKRPQGENATSSATGHSGLSAGNDTGFVNPEHDPPELLEILDDISENMVKSTLRKYEKEIVKSDTEQAVVITRSGLVWKCHGVKSSVFPDVDLGVEMLQGAYVTHNHPEDVTEYSFSEGDSSFFINYKLKLLHGCDSKYIYELTEDATQIDEMPEDWMNEENFAHAMMIKLTKRYGIGYRRWKND